MFCAYPSVICNGNSCLRLQNRTHAGSNDSFLFGNLTTVPGWEITGVPLIRFLWLGLGLGHGLGHFLPPCNWPAICSVIDFCCKRNSKNMNNLALNRILRHIFLFSTINWFNKYYLRLLPQSIKLLFPTLQHCDNTSNSPRYNGFPVNGLLRPCGISLNGFRKGSIDLTSSSIWYFLLRSKGIPQMCEKGLIFVRPLM